MKSKLILLILIFLLTIIYLLANNYTYYYGLSKGLISSKLPYKFKPKYLDWDYGNKGFTFENEYEIYFLYEGSILTIDDKDYKVDKINSYYFNKEKLVLELNIEGRKNFVLVNKNNNKGQQFLYDRINDKDIAQIISDTKEIDIKNNFNIAKNYNILSNYLVIVIILLSTFFIFILIKKRKNRR